MARARSRHKIQDIDSPINTPRTFHVPNPRTKAVQLCLDPAEVGFVSSMPDGSYTGEAAFAATVYDCASYDVSPPAY